MAHKTYRSKSHKRRHTHKRSRRHTHKYHGGRGGAELGHAYESQAYKSQAYTTGASQTLYQLTGRTPGLSSGGKRGTSRRKFTI